MSQIAQDYKLLFIDFETRSTADLAEVGPYKYSVNLTTDVICIAYITCFDDEPNLWIPNTGNNSLLDLLNAISKGAVNYKIVAHNAIFERCIYDNVLVKKHGFPRLPFDIWLCSAALAAVAAIPRKLQAAADVLNLDHRKDISGSKVMLKLSKPKRTTGGEVSFYSPSDAPQDFNKLYEYCKFDVLVEKELYNKLPKLKPLEQKIWELDQKINLRGIYVDMDLVASVLRLKAEYESYITDTCMQITDGQIDTPNKRACIEQWAQSKGFTLESYTKQYITRILSSNQEIPEDVRTMLMLRQETGKSSVAKYDRILQSVCDDNRVRDTLYYHGASTGRWSGKLVQFQNMPRGNIKDIEVVTNDIKTLSLADLKLKYGSVLDLFSQAIRGVVVAPKGKKLIVADYAQIEARVVAWLSGQDDIVQEFKTGAQIYEKMGAYIFNKDISEISKDSLERFIGKETILGCGYQMGVDKFYNTCLAKGLAIDKSIAEIAVSGWREKNYKIVKQWGLQNKAALLAFKTGRPITAGKVTWFTHKEFLYCRLPSGRNLSYFKPAMEKIDTNFGKKLSLCTFSEKMFDGKKAWALQAIYGGLLVENITQAIARDIMMHAALRLEESGYAIILSVHDELIAEVDEDFGSVEEFIDIMCDIPKWAEGCPIKAEGWSGMRYRK